MKKRHILISGLLPFMLTACDGKVADYWNKHDPVSYVKNAFTSNDEDSKAFVDKTIPAIASTWDTATFMTYADQSVWGKPDTKQMLDMLFMSYRPLGKLLHYDGATGASHMVEADGKQSISARYVAKGTFQAGSASMDVTLVKNADGWKIQIFRITTAIPSTTIAPRFFPDEKHQ